MSKPIVEGPPRPRLAPEEQVKNFADVYRGGVNPQTLAKLQARTRVLGLDFSGDELLVLAALDTPDKAQEFLNTQIYYNDDHASADLEETAMPPRRVLQTGMAHCFEGALFAYAVNYLHGHALQLLLLEASQDSEHNLVLFQDPQTGLYGANAHSRYFGLDGRRAEYRTARELAESYYPYYYSDRTNNPQDLTLVGYSEPFNLLPKFGVEWMDSEQMLWDIYYTYIDDTLRLRYLFDDSGETHLYPVLKALKSRWIQVDAAGRPFVSVQDLPPAARELWDEFWRAFKLEEIRPRGAAREIEQAFFKLTGTTPIDLQDNADDFQYFLAGGYRVEQIVTQSS